jgi:DNA (cytosine-5)-methyltransferase 1
MNHVDHPKALTHISLCAGYGGIDLGLTRALGAVRTVAFSEIEAFACANLVSKMEKGLLDVAPIWTDLKTFPWEQFRGSVDILSGGFPCQPFSAAGRRAGDDDPRHLWPHIVRGIEQLGRPPIVFFENVEGILSSRLSGDAWSDEAGTPVLLHVLRELERLGYDATAGVFSAREVGAPHQRKRVFILGTNLNSAGRDIVNGLLDNVVDSCFNGRKCTRASIHSERRALDGRWARISSERNPPNTHAQYASLSANREGTAYPAPRGAEQYDWEPPRVIMDGDGQIIDNRTDELRLLGNGVVPDTAARAFSVLWGELRRQTKPTLGRDTHGPAGRLGAP